MSDDFNHLLLLLLGRIAVLRRCGHRPIAGDGIAWSVFCLSVCYDDKPCKKKAEPIEISFGILTRVGSWNHVLEKVQKIRTLKQRGNFEEQKGRPI